MGPAFHLSPSFSSWPPRSPGPQAGKLRPVPFTIECPVVSHETFEENPPTLSVQLHMLDDGIAPPSYAHPGDAGADLRSRIDLVLAPGERALVPTGVSLALPFGFVALIHPRSGLATKQGLTIVNSPGTVDAGYRGEVSVTLLNTDLHHSITLKRGDRIAQMVIQRVERAEFIEVAQLPDSVRGTGGFGSTGGFAAPLGETAARNG
ncbi:dUTP diphosphatase [Arthrobacter stackebrandtii]|nr:dUTP diphosphatase [Arthrobacter stackebrandtii]